MPPSEQFKKQSLSYSSNAHPKLDLTQDTFDILSYLAFHYGFIPPFPLQSDSPVALKDWQDNIKNIGLDVSKNSLSVDLAMSIVKFLQGFQSAAGLSEELWDLHPHNCRHIDQQCLNQIITKQSDNLFFLAPSALCDEPHCPWTVALTTAINALFIY